MSATDNVDSILASGIAELGLAGGGAVVKQLHRYLKLLERGNRRMNLTAACGIEEMAVRHVLDSLSIHPLVRGRVLDVGSGAGLPGLPLALALPALHVTLLESRARKAEFLREAVQATGAGNATVTHGRVEAREERGKFDTLTVRAVGAVDQVLQMSGHLCAEGGAVVMMKGPRHTAELAAAEQMRDWRFNVLPLTVPGLAARRFAVIATKTISGE